MSLHSQSQAEVLKQLSVDPAVGLSAVEVAARREKYGDNKLREKKKKTTFQRFLDQFKDVMILILIAAAIISFVMFVIAGFVQNIWICLPLSIVLTVATLFVMRAITSKKENA